jgi:WD40 repeat protein
LHKIARTYLSMVEQHLQCRARHQTGKELRAFKGHEGWVVSVAFSPDGAHVLTGSTDKTSRLWDIETGKELRDFKGHEGTVDSVAFSPDGAHMLTGSLDKTARLWDTVTGTQFQVFKHEDFVLSAFSPDGARVLTDSKDKTVRLWDVATGKELHAFQGASGCCNFRRLQPRWHARADRIKGQHRPAVGRRDW